MSPEPGCVFWLFGLSGAGKSTLADRLTHELRGRGRAVLALDGDRLREGLCHGLGFSDDDRTENLRRAAEAARLGVSSGLCVVASFITPMEKQRTMIRSVIGADHLTFIFINAPLDVCRSRDAKGLYARERAGKVPQMTGLTSGFERPVDPGFEVRTDQEAIAASAEKIFALAQRRLTSGV